MAKRAKSVRTQFPLRTSEALHAQIEKAAKAAGKPMNTEIVERLEESFATKRRLGGPRATVLGDEMGSLMAKVGECGGYYAFGKIGQGREWLDFTIPYDRAVAAVIDMLETNRPAVDGAVPRRNAIETIKKIGVEVIERSAIEVERQAQRAVAEAPEPSSMWDHARKKTEVLYGLTPAAQVSTPQELNQEIQRTYERLGALLAALETSDPEKKK